MKIKSTIVFIFFSLASFSSFGQNNDSIPLQRVPKHFISINPINLILCQQAGIAYEFKLGRFGFGLSTGYMYANNWNYSYYCIEGPVDYGALGYYSGIYFIPQLSFYFLTKRSINDVFMLYASLRGVYRYMTVDSLNYIPWLNDFQREKGDYQKMEDKVDIRAVFVNIGFKVVHHHFFFDMTCGYGILDVYHDMIVYGVSSHQGPGVLLDVPYHDSYYNWHMAVNFNFTLGIAF
jgi:hypothetical protein